MAITAKILKAIIRNDAMKQDFGGMLFGWDVGTIGGVLAMPAMQEKYGFKDYDDKGKANMSQNIASTLQAGCFLACFITPWLTDKWGRRWALIGTGAVTTVGVILQAGSAGKGSLAAMYVGRFVAGLGVGAASMLTPLYVSECAPRAIRGGLTAFYQLFIVTGVMISFWINYGALQHFKGAATYVVPLALQALPAVLLILFMFMVPESPRWTAKQDNWEETTRIISKLRALPTDHSYVQNEIQEMAQQLENERRLIGEASTKTLLKEMWLVPGNRKRAIISVFLMIWQQMTGVNAINYYAPQIFRGLGMTGTSVQLFATGVYGIVKVVGCFVFLVFAADSLGRRWSLLWTSAAQAISMYIVGAYGKTEPPQEGKPISAFGYVAIVLIYLWAVFFQFGWGPVCWILVSEIPTARLRALNVAIGAATQWLFNFIIARTVLTMQVTMGTAGYGMFFLFGTFGWIMGIFVWFFIPETKGVSLEQMDKLFGVTEAPKALEDDAEAAVEVKKEKCEKN
ncbi:putative sugar transporter protein [Thermochaetoides thermophila DSM 1495]|uniref:Putative sugar transporter protein n=1 Tax=Chaetomium thermophilum (strain DSM 1495 / CBS 144.50 / IMI 039719) TaxID=759272 RepID=G0SB62_CHATD|nr:putative sugar transporter protein [Thermochaetoides thermophila DSM 1495]EGS19442.1 putative sugar transporter protein [Thermochaetoides thermophila DSM 1495]